MCALGYRGPTWNVFVARARPRALAHGLAHAATLALWMRHSGLDNTASEGQCICLTNGSLNGFVDPHISQLAAGWDTAAATFHKVIGPGGEGGGLTGGVSHSLIHPSQSLVQANRALSATKGEAPPTVTQQPQSQFFMEGPQPSYHRCSPPLIYKESIKE